MATIVIKDYPCYSGIIHVLGITNQILYHIPTPKENNCEW